MALRRCLVLSPLDDVVSGIVSPGTAVAAPVRSCLSSTSLTRAKRVPILHQPEYHPNLPMKGYIALSRAAPRGNN